MERKEIIEIVNLALDIQLKGEGVDGFPYVYVNISNYGSYFSIMVQDGGFQKNNYDGNYIFGLHGENSKCDLEQCREHLLKLKERVSEFE